MQNDFTNTYVGQNPCVPTSGKSETLLVNLRNERNLAGGERGGANDVVALQVDRPSHRKRPVPDLSRGGFCCFVLNETKNDSRMCLGVRISSQGVGSGLED